MRMITIHKTEPTKMTYNKVVYIDVDGEDDEGKGYGDNEGTSGHHIMARLMLVMVEMVAMEWRGW